MPRTVVEYREFAPCEALREQVRAFFSFAPPGRLPASRRLQHEVRFTAADSFCSPLFADAQVSIVFSFRSSCRDGGDWYRSGARPRGEVIGPMSRCCPGVTAERPEMVGVYFRAAGAGRITGAPGWELADRVVAVEDLWGRTELPEQLEALTEPGSRIDRLESALLSRLEQGPELEGGVNVAGLARWVLRQGGRPPVQQLAEAAGISRQHLAHLFREHVGLSPKRFARLARFHAGLAYAGSGARPDWAQAALELGYADQSHMIAEFREFSSLTPQALARERWFHPFIERARRRPR